MSIVRPPLNTSRVKTLLDLYRSFHPAERPAVYAVTIKRVGDAAARKYCFAKFQSADRPLLLDMQIAILKQ